eukprot:CAMPEP_0184005664 /NCGR_PEP_ID=MMETSP0954-20121128/195_1 /TAXON_ID=627963 /ORGANISM="Aplanochytrium sp, Strain PBS07" /LENGTH=473 /DNA_ID=CAMNT_0026283991 /DNA_START=28 /DNA_END=1449 /DNA_ORIENTATION=+
MGEKATTQNLTKPFHSGCEQGSHLDDLRKKLELLQGKRKEIEEEIKSLIDSDKEALLAQQKLEDEIQSLLSKEENSNCGKGEGSKLVAASAEELKRESTSSRIDSFAPPIFLDSNDERRTKKIVLASYPRSGNSLLRSLLEKLTGVVTGTDSKPDRRLIKQLTEMGFQGEGVTDDSVMFVKTHYPERLGHRMFTAKKAIVVVRNPFDCINSYFNMVLTQTHTKSICESEYSKYSDIWEDFVCEEAKIWVQFHEHWLNKRVTSKIPVLVVRYEDLIAYRRTSLERIARFVYDTNTLDESVRNKIVTICNLSQQDSGLYTPRSKEQASDSSSGGSDNESDESCGSLVSALGALKIDALGYLKSMKYFHKGQVRFVLSTTKHILYKLKYWESFENDWGPGTESRPITSCLLFQQTQDSNTCNNEEVEVRINSRYGIRPRTTDDPNGRGFGKRWKSRIAVLPAVRIKNSESLDFRQI